MGFKLTRTLRKYTTPVGDYHFNKVKITKENSLKY